MHGDGEMDSMTRDRCESCGGHTDQGSLCAACQRAFGPKLDSAPSDAPQSDPQAAYRLGSDPNGSAQEIGFRLGSDPNDLGFGGTPATAETAPAVIALKSAVLASTEQRKTIEEATLAAPELEDLFAALESAPIRLKKEEPVAPAAPAPVPAFAPMAFVPQPAPAAPDATEPAATLTADKRPASTFEEEWLAGTTPIRVKPVIEFVPTSEAEQQPQLQTEIPFADAESFTSAAPLPSAPPVPFEPPVIAVKPLAAAPQPVEPAPFVEAPVTPQPTKAEAPATKHVVPAAANAAPKRNVRSLVGVAAAAAVVAVIGVPLSRLWLNQNAQQVILQQPQPAPHQQPQRPAPARTATPPAAPAHTAAAAAAAAPVLAKKPTAPAAAVAPKPRPQVAPVAQAAAVRATPPRPVRQTAPPTPQPASLTTLAPAVAAPSESPLAESPVAEAPAAVATPAPAPAAGPFYELNDVDSPPRAASRTDVAIPASLEGRTLNEIIVVRVLVSQTGRPALVSLLRSSKSGLALDEAVIAAVRQWTFAPAVKRGQAVSCFYHVGVPVGR